MVWSVCSKGAWLTWEVLILWSCVPKCRLSRRNIVVLRLLNGGSCLWDSSILLSAESLCKQSHATGTGSVAQSYAEVGITVVVSLGAVRQQSAFHQEQGNAGVASHGSVVTALSVPL